MEFQRNRLHILGHNIQLFEVQRLFLFVFVSFDKIEEQSVQITEKLAYLSRDILFLQSFSCDCENLAFFWHVLTKKSARACMCDSLWICAKTTVKMRLPQHFIVIISLVVMSLHSCESSRYSQLTIVDLTIKRFFNDEEAFWSDINASTSAQASNATLTKLFAYFDSSLSVLGVGSVDAVRMINEELAGYIDEINRKQHSETRWLAEKNYDHAQQHCETISETIPSEMSQVFDITKSPPFMAYLRENSDFCQTNKRIVSPGVEDLHLQNVVMDFYVTVVEALVKGYMTSQMAYMVQGVKGTR